MTTKDRVIGMMKRASAAKAFYGKVMQKRAEHVKLAAAQRLYGKVMQKRAGIAEAKHLEACYMEGFGKAAEAYGVDPEELYKAATSAWEDAWNGIKSVGKGAARWGGNLAGAVAGGVTGYMNGGYGNTWDNITGGAKAGWQAGGDAAVDSARNMYRSLGDSFTGNAPWGLTGRAVHGLQGINKNPTAGTRPTYGLKRIHKMPLPGLGQGN